MARIYSGMGNKEGKSYEDCSKLSKVSYYDQNK